MIPLITLEEHFFTPSYLNNSHFYAEQFKWLPDLQTKLTDLGPIRLSEMDKGAVTLQIISHGPGLSIHPVSESQNANNQLAAAIKKEGGKRFAGFAVLPMAFPDDAAAELRRVVKEFGFVGALVDNHADGKYYDDRKFWPVFEAAQELDVPIYLHPTWPDEELAPRFEGNFSKSAEMSMGSSGFGWHYDVGLHVLKLFAAGVFDEYPKLKIIIGHMGECLPFMLERIAMLSRRWGERKRDWKQVYDENLWITTSGVWSINPMACLLRNTKIERILYSVDYPFAKNESGLEFMEELEKSGLVTKEQFEMIGYKNAQDLLKVKV